MSPDSWTAEGELLIVVKEGEKRSGPGLCDLLLQEDASRANVRHDEQLCLGKDFVHTRWRICLLFSSPSPGLAPSAHLAQ